MHFIFHLVSGGAGLVVGVIIFSIIWFITYLRCPFASITFEPRGPGSFDSRLGNYTKAAETIVGLASGSVVLLAGSSVLRTNSHFPASFSSPLVLLGVSVVYAVLFIAFLTRFYEYFLHFPDSYTKFKYSLVQALGFSSLCCFSLAYVWLAMAIGGL